MITPGDLLVGEEPRGITIAFTCRPPEPSRAAEFPVTAVRLEPGTVLLALWVEDAVWVHVLAGSRPLCIHRTWLSSLAPPATSSSPPRTHLG